MNVPAFHNNLGMALEHMGRFGGAAEAYKGALAADPVTRRRSRTWRASKRSRAARRNRSTSRPWRVAVEESKVASDDTREEQ